MEQVRDYSSIVELTVTNGVAFIETELCLPREFENTITLHKHLAEMDLRFATGIRQKELRHDLDILNNTQVNGDFVEVYIPYSGSSSLFCDISTAAELAWMLSEVASREKADREADIRIVMIEASPQPERFIKKVMNFISGGYYY